MGDIVTLSPQRRQRRASVRTTDEATILLFMGVRYVRDDEPTLPVEHRPADENHRDEVPLELA